ncbi:hypothetical protein FHW84_003464 [Dyella sp. SG562]|jgi:hypothetical protein|uniref:DUF1579 domain-containing protein n=1 Tax=Dyella sp. SG562 TaxID=2587017 RepID=UPI001424184A|nr:DUF1579 domain-containing protein [Dyella sp. SG562]NII74868.1 hypothetical protein [Dyella sp. SG562]
MFKHLPWSFAFAGMLSIAGALAAEAGPQPPPEMAALYPRIGTWKVLMRTGPSESLPKGGVDNGVMVMKKGPGGFSIVQEFTSHGTSGDVVGQSYAWWDAKAKAYKSVWCDNMQGCVDFVTVVKGNSWTVELDGESNGKKVHTTIRATMSADHNRIEEEVANAYDGGPMHVETVSYYTRIPDSGAARETHAQ